MSLEVTVPSPGESVTEVEIANWLKKSGDYVFKDEEICEIDSDKATLTLNAEESGKIEILAAEGDTVKVTRSPAVDRPEIDVPTVHYKKLNHNPDGTGNTSLISFAPRHVLSF